MYVIGSVSKKIIFYDSIFCMNTQGKEHRMYYSYLHLCIILKPTETLLGLVEYYSQKWQDL